MALIRTDCILCSCNESALVQPGSLGDRDVDPAGCYSSSRWFAGHFPIVHCTGCGLVRSLWRDDDCTIASIYHRLEDALYESEYRQRLRTADAYLGWLNRFCSQPQALLDIGCSTGIFLSRARQAGWHVSGLEPSRWAAGIAAGRLPDSNIQVGAINEASFPQLSFDVVTLWDVLEHLVSPTASLSCIHSWLKASGWLFLNTPDIDSLPARLMGRRWVLFLREHIWYFSLGTLAKLLEKCGFRLVASRSNAVNFSLGTVLERLYQQRSPAAKADGPRFRLHPTLRQVPLRFPIGEITVAAQKL